MHVRRSAAVATSLTTPMGREPVREKREGGRRQTGEKKIENRNAITLSQQHYDTSSPMA